MKRFALIAVAAFAVATFSICTAALAANFVTSAVFSIASSAATATPNLRVAPMTPKTAARDDNSMVMQWFQWQANQTQNLYLTKDTTVDISSALCAWVQVDQATKVKVNAEAAYMILPSGYNDVVCFK